MHMSNIYSWYFKLPGFSDTLFGHTKYLDSRSPANWPRGILKLALVLFKFRVNYGAIRDKYSHHSILVANTELLLLQHL